MKGQKHIILLKNEKSFSFTVSLKISYRFRNTGMVSYRFILNSIQPYQHAYIHQIQYWVEKWIFINIHVIWWLLIDTGIKGKIDGLISFHLYHIWWWNILVVISFPFFFKQKKSPIPFYILSVSCFSIK